ncbi:transcriptional regulator, TetR family [Pseudonocardia thermophila]|jgi:Transcriptional regulator|uniref:Transcriptional regulator, TetR family n=1 Tax=Pseudonocardia thermophila TaxID=1848 RepID=A0A1M6XVM5_PSETH|nr:TetR/AcrR family transcriptional regulator [Pseudonocardia thermophila]SHL10037.1 transcriptional regulator, TetR family [Pseudonocardia thermophila]
MAPDDPRARRTRASLRAAALELAGERDPATLTLSAVAARAGVNRATVYLHYPDLDALFADAMEEAVAAVAQAAQLCPLDAPAEPAPPPLVTLFEHVREHATLYARMLGPQGSARFAARLRAALTEAVQERFRAGARPASDVPLDVHAAFLAGALVGVIAHCASCDEDPADAAAATWRLFGDGGRVENEAVVINKPS